MGDIGEKTETVYMLCPENHGVPVTGWNYAQDDSDGDFDCNGIPMAEHGLWCYSCDRSYGLSKLREME